MIWKLLANRLGLGLLTLWLVSVLIFVGTEILPGDVAEAILGQSATPETVKAIRDALHLDRPAHVRYFEWLAGIVQGDLGLSLANGRPVATLVSDRLGNTLFLAGVTAAVAVPLSIGIGLATAMLPNGRFDRSVNVGALVGISVPEFFLAYVLIFFFAVRLGWFPAISRSAATASELSTRLHVLALPIVTLTLAMLAHMMRMTRAAVLAVLGEAYVEMAVLKGVPRWRIILFHALPNAVAPIATVVALNMAYLVVGVIVVEVIFAFPGMGQLMVDAVGSRDIPLVQACAVIFAGTYVVLNLVADLVGIFANPRLRLPR